MNPFKYILIGLLILMSFHVSAQKSKKKKKGKAPVELHFNGIAISDSGFYDENNLKSGQWREYALDTFQSATDTTPAQLVIVKEQGLYVKGKKQGEWKVLMATDKQPSFYWELMGNASYADGKKHGWQKRYTTDNQLVSQEYFANGKLDSMSVFYYINGVPQLVIQYKNGVQHGKSYEFYPNRIAKKAVDYVNGYSHGKLEIYHPNGTLKESGNVVNGKFKGEYSWHYDTGVLKQKGFFEDTLKTGKWQTYYPTGELESKYTYENNLAQGEWKCYHKNGQLWSVRQYKDSKLWEVVSNFNPEGKTRNAGTLKDGTGTILIYNDAGEVSKKLNYVAGLETKLNDDQ
ncbi:MAG: hypothetical protein COA57_10255 [Flavobacteriales bacterium]|nr:MAG: hypothetical protein COA57_10255 [Flavobacteriales bacterium]